MLAAADCGPDWWIGVGGISGDTPQRREVWVSARVAADVNTPETPVQAKDPQDRCRIGSSKARVQVGPEAFQDTPPNRRGDSGQRLVMAVWRSVQGLPECRRSSWCPTRPSTPGFYALVTRRTGPSQESCCAQSAPDAGRVARWGSAPIRSWGWSALVDRPEEVDDRRAPRALGG